MESSSFPIWRLCSVDPNDDKRWWFVVNGVEGFCILGFFQIYLCFVSAQTLGWTFLLLDPYFSFGLYLYLDPNL